MGWGKGSHGGVTIHEIEFHHTQILREPHVKIFGKRLAEHLTKVRAANSANAQALLAGSLPEQPGCMKSNKGQILKNVGSSWFSLGVNVVTGIFLSPFILHHLGDETFTTTDRPGNSFRRFRPYTRLSKLMGR